jgi:hypothetical protein
MSGVVSARALRKKIDNVCCGEVGAKDVELLEYVDKGCYVSEWKTV